MTESQFISQNKKDWRELESLLKQKTKNPDKLNRLFLKVSSDLSYARTFYPNRSVRLYLNNLTQQVFDSLKTKHKNSTLKEVFNFFSKTLPFEVYRSRKAFFSSLIVFILAVSIGVISSANQPDFPAIILGQHYIDITEENISNGDPMAIYKDERKESMFFNITTNNIRVAFMAFVLGLLGSIGTYIILISNGIMLGAFQYFFYSKGLFLTSFLTIWIHGTIEISAIIIAGAAGIILGNGILFPKSYSRIKSLQMASLKAIRILIGVIPLFIIAGMLESYVTRHTEFENSTKALIIGLSFLFILLQWVIYPIIYRFKNKDLDIKIDNIEYDEEVFAFEKNKLRSFSNIITTTITHYRLQLGSIFKNISLFTLLPFAIIVFLFLKLFFSIENPVLVNSLIDFENGGAILLITSIVMTTFLVLFSKLKFDDKMLTIDNLKSIHTHKTIAVTIIITLYTLAIFSNNWTACVFVFILIPPHLITFICEEEISIKNAFDARIFLNAWKKSLKTIFSYIPSYFVIFFLYLILMLLSLSPLVKYLVDFITWHQIFDYNQANLTFINQCFNWLLFALTVPFIYNILSYSFHSNNCKDESIDLNKRLSDFGNSSPIFEQY